MKKGSKLKIFLIIIIIFLLLLETLPSVYSSPNDGVSGSASDYGILQALDDVLSDKETKLNSPEIENETKARLNQMKLVEFKNNSYDLNYQVDSIQAIDHRDFEPIIFNELVNSELIDFTTIIDFLLNRPLNYYIFTKSYDKITWTEAMVRPSLDAPFRWKYIDVDHNQSNGNEIRARFDVVLDSWKFDPEFIPSLPPSFGTFSIKAGLGLNITREVNRTFPLELYILKSISYEGENYIWITGAEFDQTPGEYKSVLLAETIEFGKIRERIRQISFPNIIQQIVNTTLAEINGPYSLKYDSDIDLKKFNIMAGLAKYENLSLTAKNWLVFLTTPADGFDYVSRSGEVWVDSSNVQQPIDQLRWTSGVNDPSGRNKIPIHLRIRYGEMRKYFIFADVGLINVPEMFTLDLDYNKVEKGKNVTVLDYSAADVLSELNYTSYLYPDYQLDPMNGNCTHIVLKEVPKKFHMELTSDIGRDINTTLYNDPKIGIMANIINNMVVRIANRFYRVGKYLKLAAEGILDLPTEDGWAVVNAFDEQFKEVSFYQTSSEYLITPGNFISFFNISNNPGTSDSSNYSNNTDSNQTNGQNIVDYAISGRITNLKWANLTFGKPLELELRALNGNSFQGLLIDGENSAHIHFSNLPKYIKIANFENYSLYSTVDPEVEYENEKGTIIDQFSFTSRFEQMLLRLEIEHIPGGLEFSRNDKIVHFSAIEDNYIGGLDYFITSDLSLTIYQMNIGDNVFIFQDEEYITSTGKLSGLKTLTYDSSEDGYFELKRNEETPFHIMLIDNKTEHTKAKVILDPLPSNLKVDLPGLVRQSNIEIPDITNLASSLDYSEMVFILGKLGEQAIHLLGNVSEYLIESIGNIGQNFSISYELEDFGQTMDIIAEIERGGIQPGVIQQNPYSTSTDEILGHEIGWTHGIYMKQDVYEGEEILRGHLYLQGMPKTGKLSTTFEFNSTIVDLEFKDYYPRYNWLLIDLKGIQDRDVNVFFQHIPEGVDLLASVDLTTNLEIGGEMTGEVDILFTDIGEKYFVCNERLAIGEFNNLASEISGVPLPGMRLPDSLAMFNARLVTALANVIRKPPILGMAVDQMRTMKEGFEADGGKAERELGLRYTPIRTALEEAIAACR